jgi:hypothetical protein
MGRPEGAQASSDVELAEETMDKRGVCDRPGCFQGPCDAVSSFFLGLAKYARRGESLKRGVDAATGCEDALGALCDQRTVVSLLSRIEDIE